MRRPEEAHRSAEEVPGSGRPGSAAMARESKKAKAERASEAFSLLAEEYPDAHCALEHRDAYQLGVATILSAQTTDDRVNMVTPELFERYPTPRELAGAIQEDVEEIIHSTGFFRNKTKNIIGFAQGVTDRHGGEVPRAMSELTAWPGLGRLGYHAILERDFPVILTLNFIAAVLTLAGTLLSDILYAVVDPRVRTRLEGED